MSKLKAILFDYDGTLRDSRSLIYASLEHTFEAHDLPAPTKDELAPHIHHHSFVHEAFAPDVPYDDFEKEYFNKVGQLMPSVGLYDGVVELLSELQSQGYRIGLVTAAKTATQDLQRLQIDKYFAVTITANDITKHKPDPQGINLALERLEVAADEAVYIGDMMTDIYAAQAAHLRAAVGVTIGLANRRELETAGADFIVDSIAEIPALIQKIEQEK